MYNFDPYNVLLSIATNIPVLLMTAFVLQGHRYKHLLVAWETDAVVEISIRYSMKHTQTSFSISVYIYSPEAENHNTLQRSGVVSVVELGQEVCGTLRLGLVEVAHDVRLLLPDVDGLLQLHLPLQHRSERSDHRRSR